LYVLNNQVIAGENSILLPLQHLAAGNYFVKIVSGSMAETVKLLVEK
jgi:hypothetical protein